MFAQDVFERLGLSQNTDLLHELQKDALVEPTEATQSPYMDDPAYAGFETLRGLFGAHHGENPAMYWLAQGKEMPEFATVADAQAAVWKDFRGKAQAYKAEQKRQQQAREALAATIDPLIDRYVRGDGVVPSPEQMTMMQQAGISWDSIRRARRGRQLVQEYDAQGALYDDKIINNLAEQVGDDELARRIVLNMFYNDARKYAKDKHGDEWTGINWIDKAQQGVTGMLRTGGIRTARVAQRAWRNLQVLGEVDATANAAKRLPELIAAGMSQEEAYAQIEQDKKELEIRRRWTTDLVQTMEAGEQEYLESHDRNLIGRIGSQLGSIVGDTAPWFIPIIGPAIGASAATQSRSEEGTAMGLSMQEAEKRAIMFGQADALEEMIAFSPIGRLTPGYKWLKKALGSGKAAEKLAPWRTKWLASPKVQYAVQGLSGAAEEAILEPTAGYLMRTVQSMNLTDERGQQTFRQYLDDMSQMMHGEQGLALLAFTFGMSGFNYPQIKRAAQDFGLSLQHYKGLGGTEQGFLEARSEKTANGFLNKALSNLHDAWIENPEEACQRAHQSVREKLSAERIQSLRELDSWKAAEAAGEVPRIEPAEQDGMFRVYAPTHGIARWDEGGAPVQTSERGNLEAVIGGKKQQEDTAASGQQESVQSSYTLMDGEQMTAYLQAFVSEQVENDILYTQNMLAGDVAVNQALAQKRFDAAEVITRTEADEQTGAERVVIAPETLGQMKARADMAMAAIRALEAEGVNYQEAAARMDASLSEHIPLGTLVQTWDEAQERIRTEQARNPEFKVPSMDAPFSRAYVTKVRRGDTFRRVLRYARGSATVEDLMEETMEQAVISWQAEQNTTWGEFGTMLQEAQRSINDLFPEARGKDMQFIHLDAGKPVTGHDAIEAFSKIGRSRWLADALNHPSLPSWLRKLLNHLVKFLGAFKARVELGEMVRQAEEQGVFTLPVRQALAVMLDAGNALYRDQQGDLIALTMERAKAQAELDAALGRGVATEQEAVEEQLAERNAADEPGPVDRAQEDADDANAQQARRERTEAEVEMLGERDDDGVFNGGVSIRIEDGVRQGFIDKDRLTLCPDVPQFKQGADEKTGVVNRIVGAWQRNAAPISVWRRTDGSLQVISGRHRLDACTDADINCTVYEEGDRFNLDWARRHDVENNIRDGQASAFEIARYVRDSSLSMAEAVERGIARKGASLKGVELGLYASQELLDALGNGLVSADDAYRVALAFRNDAEVQRSGLAVLLDGGSWQESYNTMAAKANLEAIARQNAANGMDMGMDLFGNTDNEELYKRIGKYAAEKYRELGKELTAINGASRNPKVARKYGVNVNDAAAVQQVVKRLQEERARWKNFAVHPDLLKEANDAVMVEMGLKSREDVDRENGVLPLEDPEQEAESADQGTLMLSQDVSRMLDDFMNRGNTHFSLAGENEALLAPNGKPSNLAPEQYRQVRTPEFKKWFGDWEKVATFKDAYERIMTMPPVTALTGQEFQKDGVPLTEKVTKLWKEQFNGIAISPELGEVRLDLEGVKSSIGHGIGSLKSAAFACVEDVIRNGIVFDRQENWKGRGYDTAVIAAPVTIKDVEYICEVVVEQRSNRQGFYLHEVEIKKKLEDVFKTSTEGGTPQASRSILALRAEDVKREEENMSKVVDENGEPRVVYHGTDSQFTVFDSSKVETSWYSHGFYFSDKKSDAKSYGDNIVPVFLNIRNPFMISKEGWFEELTLEDKPKKPELAVEATATDTGNGFFELQYRLEKNGEWISPISMRRVSPLQLSEHTPLSLVNYFLSREYNNFLPRNVDSLVLQAAIKEAGHDGVIGEPSDFLHSGKEYVAYEPTQIKSATDNRGTFDGENSDITFSIIGEKAESFMDYHNNGLSYTDPADGKRKAIIDSRGVRLKKERMGVSEGGHVNVSLAAALDFPELFRAYPELRKLRVDFYRDSKSTTGGFTDQRENYIAVNLARGGKNTAPGMVLDTILHEVQHVIQWYEGFAVGAGNMSREQALAYLSESMNQLQGRGDDWAKEALPRLERMKRKLEEGTLQPPFVYIFSHGEQEARLAGRFSENGTGVVMSGLNGFRLLDKPAFSIPLTGNITELGGITFGAGRFGRLADRILSPNGDWLYDEMVFKMRAATQRAVTKLDLYHAGNREAGLEMIAECQELISTVERFLPNTYGFGLEPYKIWLNVFSLLYGGARRGSEVQDIVSNALAAIPMSKWPEIMEGSFIKSFVKWARNRPELEAVIEEAQTEIAERQSDYELDSSPGADNKAARAARKGVEQEVWHKLFLEYGAEFLEEYGEKKVYRLVGKFMRRVVEQIDRCRKDRTLGRIRRVVASVAPKRTPKGKPLRGKMDVAAYEKLAGYMRLLEMTGAQHEEFFRKKYPVKKDQETGEEVDPWDQVKADDMVSIVLPDDKGQPSEVTVPKLAFETYACYEKMNVERAECCARALGELISTSRDAWENARVKKQQELEAMLKPVFEAAGRTDASARGSFRTLDKLKNPVKWTLGLLDGFMNGYQYFDSLARVKPFAPIARHFADRLAVAEANVASGEKEMMLARANAAAEASGLTDEYDLSDWVLERRKKRDTGIVITEQEPDWAAQARQKYRDGLVGLVRRKVRKHGADKVMAQAVALIRMDERMKSELDLLWPASGGWEFDRERDAVVFTEGELKRYGNQQEYVREHAEQERGRSKYAREGYVPRSMPLDALSRMEAAYLILLHEQADYTDAMRLLGFTPEVMDQLRDFAGEDVITFSYALRDVLNKRSQDVKNAMERKTGTPFPLVDHYFRAFFDVGFQSVEKTILDAASYGEAAGGGKFGMTYARKKNRLRLDLNMDVCTAFDAAMREQTLFLHMSEVSNDLRRLLSYRGEEGDAAAGLEKLLGRDAMSKLKAWSDAMDRAGAETVIGHLHANRLINAVSSAAARTLLPGRVGTWIKQWTGILNTLHSSDALDASDWLGSMKRAATGRLVMSVKEMKKQPELSSRYKGMSALNEAMNADGAGRHVSRLGKANRRAMEDIERRDMQANAISCAVLYDAMYRKVQREEPDAGKEKWHEAAMMEVRRSLSSKGQPMVLTQRSLNAQTRQWMTVGMFFLGGESINTFAKCLDLFRRGDMKHVGRGMAVWVAHGLLVALMDGLLHWFTDDEKKRKRRSAWDLLYYTIAGPLAGIPIVSGLLGDGLESLGHAAGLNVWNPKDSSLIPLSNWSDVSRAGKRVARVFDGKPHDWTDYPLAFADALRIAAAGSIAFNARSSRAGAAVEGAALTTAAFVNLMEFALKTGRSVQENGTDLGKWTGNRK